MTDLRDVAALLAREHPGNPRFVDDRFLRWLYLDNPVGEAFVETAEVGGRAVAHFALVPQRYCGPAGRTTFVLSVNAVTESGSGQMRFVQLTLRATRRAAEHGGILGGLGVANESSTIPAVARLRARVVRKLPVELLVPMRRSRGVVTERADRGYLDSERFRTLVEELEPRPSEGWAQEWDLATLRWRLAAPGSRYLVHVADDLVGISTRTTAYGVPVAVVLKLLVRPGHSGPVTAGRIVTAACRAHRCPAAVYAGFNAGVAVRGVPVPSSLRPAALNLLFLGGDEASRHLHTSVDGIEQHDVRFDTFELLDFDAL